MHIYIRWHRVMKECVLFLTRATVDYTMELIKRAFVITANPNVEDGCGCGISFSPKEEL